MADGGLDDVELILVILAAFYCFECMHWVGVQTICFSSARGPLRWYTSPRILSNDRGGLVLANPLPWRETVICQGRANTSWLPVGDATTVDALDQNTPREPSSARVVAAIDRAALVARRKQVRQAIRPLRSWTTFLFVWVFAVGPGLYYLALPVPLYGNGMVLALYLFGAWLAWWLTIRAYFKTHRVVQPKLRGERWKHALMMLVSPATAMRGVQAIITRAYLDFHPLVIAVEVCAIDDVKALAGQFLRQNRYLPPSDEAVARAGHSHERNIPDGDVAPVRARFESELRDLLTTAGIDWDELDQPPERDCDAQAYCPRCLSQFVRQTGQCDACGGVPLVAFADQRAGCCEPTGE